MKSSRRLLAGLLLLSLRTAQAGPPVEKVLEAMKKATAFMVEKVSTNGGYLWTYLPDLSRRWGEMEAYDSMIWVQPPGHEFLCHHPAGTAPGRLGTAVHHGPEAGRRAHV